LTPRAVLASGNPHKLEELQRALPGWELALLERQDFPPECGETYLENARAKASFGRRHAAPAAWSIGEDSGIEAAALGGRPGVESARWATDGVSRLLDELTGSSDRRARYVCALVAIGPDGAELAAEGTLDGEILDGPPRGSEGFGYDPIFVPAGEVRTVAELGGAWKSRNSHRARAASALAGELRRSTRKAGILRSGFLPRDPPSAADP
jgi:XTP/dITP diphosphohydrolase